MNTPTNGDGAATTTPPTPREAEPAHRALASTSTEVRRAGRLLIGAAAVGVLTDIGLRGGPVGLGSALTIAALAIGLVVIGEEATTERKLFVALAVLSACGLVWRTSPWIVVADWVAALGFLGLAATARPGRSVIRTSLPGLAVRAVLPVPLGPVVGGTAVLDSLGVLRRRPRSTTRERSAFARTWPSVVRGVLIGAPILLVLGALLASADAMFASFVDLPIPNVGKPLPHVILIGLGASIVAGLARPSNRSGEVTAPRLLGPVEALVVLVGVAALYALFAVSRLVTSLGGDAKVAETTGLTYAEYARTGFFQLLWAAAITMAVLLGVRAVTRPGGGRLSLATRVVSAITCGLTLVVVVSAITRLELYRDAYGLTMLRLASTTFAFALGAAFVLLAARQLVDRGADWLPAAFLGLATITLCWWNVSNPERTVVDTNLDQAVATGKLDIGYLDTLSDDAIPAMVAGIDRLPDQLATKLRTTLCSRHDPTANLPGDPMRPHVQLDADGVVRVRPGWAAFNVSRAAAADALPSCDLGSLTAPG